MSKEVCSLKSRLMDRQGGKGGRGEGGRGGGGGEGGKMANLESSQRVLGGTRLSIGGELPGRTHQGNKMVLHGATDIVDPDVLLRLLNRIELGTQERGDTGGRGHRREGTQEGGDKR